MRGMVQGSDGVLVGVLLLVDVPLLEAPREELVQTVNEPEWEEGDHHASS